MGPKLLFVLGIVLAHGALGAAWMHREGPHERSPLSTCVNTPMPYFHSHPEPLLARVVPDESAVQATP